MISVLKKLANLSLSFGIVPQLMTDRGVILTLQKPNVGAESLKNFWPFLAKLTEYAVATQYPTTVRRDGLKMTNAAQYSL